MSVNYLYLNIHQEAAKDPVKINTQASSQEGYITPSSVAKWMWSLKTFSKAWGGTYGCSHMGAIMVKPDSNWGGDRPTLLSNGTTT